MKTFLLGRGGETTFDIPCPGWSDVMIAVQFSISGPAGPWPGEARVGRVGGRVGALGGGWRREGTESLGQIGDSDVGGGGGGYEVQGQPRADMGCGGVEGRRWNGQEGHQS